MTSSINVTPNTFSVDHVRVVNGYGSNTDPVIIGDGNSSITVDGSAYQKVASFNRPNNTTAYAAGDVIGAGSGSAIIELTNAGPAGGFVIVQSVSLTISLASVPSGMGAFRVHLFNAVPNAIADNDPFDLSSGERSQYRGYIDLPAPQDLGSTIYTQTDYPGRMIKLAAGETRLWAELETRNAFTPAAETLFRLVIDTLEAGR
jgi:hypothetical protein